VCVCIRRRLNGILMLQIWGFSPRKRRIQRRRIPRRSCFSRTLSSASFFNCQPAVGGAIHFLPRFPNFSATGLNITDELWICVSWGFTRWRLVDNGVFRLCNLGKLCRAKNFRAPSCLSRRRLVPQSKVCDCFIFYFVVAFHSFYEGCTSMLDASRR